MPPVSEMTYTVSSGTLNATIPYHTIPYKMPNKFRTRVCRMDREACRRPERIPALGSTLAKVNIRIKVETFFFEDMM